MNDNIRALGTVPKIDHVELIASGLEQLAAQVSAGQLPIVPSRAFITFAARDAGMDGVCSAFYGAEANLAETVGMLELAKISAIDDASAG